MSIVLKVVRCAGQCSWLSHQTSIVVYIEFAWNYVGFNSNYYFMRITQLWKLQITPMSSKMIPLSVTAEFQYGLGGGMMWMEVQVILSLVETHEKFNRLDWGDHIEQMRESKLTRMMGDWQCLKIEMITSITNWIIHVGISWMLSRTWEGWRSMYCWYKIKREISIYMKI